MATNINTGLAAPAAAIAAALTSANPPLAPLHPVALAPTSALYPAAAVASVLERPSLGRAPALAAFDYDPALVPKTLKDLESAITQSYDLTITRAGELNIPVVGSAGGSMNRRVVVLERIAYKELAGASGSQYRFGYAIRLCVTVNKWDATMKASLPFLAASAQMGQIEASWILQVLGVAGTKISEATAPPAELNVETFVIAKQSLEKLIAAVNDPSTTFAAQTLQKIDTAQQRSQAFEEAAVTTFALSSISRKRSLDEARKRLGAAIDPVASAILQDVYDVMAPGLPADRPTQDAANKANELLGGIQADV